jgi:hypothetical protein
LASKACRRQRRSIGAGDQVFAGRQLTKTPLRGSDSCVAVDGNWSAAYSISMSPSLPTREELWQQLPPCHADGDLAEQGAPFVLRVERRGSACGSAERTSRWVWNRLLRFLWAAHLPGWQSGSFWRPAGFPCRYA